MSSHLESPRENVVLAQKEMDHGAKGDSNKKLHVEQKKSVTMIFLFFQDHMPSPQNLKIRVLNNGQNYILPNRRRL